MYDFTSAPFLFWMFLIPSSDGICYDVVDNTRTDTGRLISSISSISECLDYCDQTPTCYAVTWNRRQPSCYRAFSNKSTYSVNFAIFFDKIEACSSPSVHDVEICNGTRAEQGILLEGPSFQVDCFNVCRRWSACTAANWDTVHNQCYVFNVEPQSWMRDSAYSHATKQSCPVTDTTIQTSPTESTTTYNDESTVESVANQTTPEVVVTTAAPELPLVGRVIYVRYRHVLNSATKQKQRSHGKSRIKCAIQCTKDSSCQGFDFNVNLRSCVLRTDNFEYEKVRTFEF